MANTFLIAEHHEGQVKRVTYEIFAELQKQGADTVVLLVHINKRFQSSKVIPNMQCP